MLMFELLFGLAGMGFCMYGKSAGRLVPLLAGAGLMVFPYFLSNLIALIVVGLLLSAVPFVLREG